MDILYQVIIENQKVRADLLKWKLIICATIAALGLGASEIKLNTLPTADLALCCIPFVAAYVDLLCSHLSLRVQLIGRFIRTTQFQTEHENSLQAYEEFVGRARQGGSATGGTVNPLGLEAKALYASSTILSLLVALYGIGSYSRDGSVGHALWFWISGGLGCCLAALVRGAYMRRYKMIHLLSPDHAPLEESC